MNVNITGPRILAEFSFFGLCDVTITQTTLTSLLVLAAVTILCWRLGRNLRKRPGRMQAVTERAVLAVYKLVDDTMGKHNERFAPYIGALFCSSVLGSLASLTGFLRSIPRDYEEAAMIDGATQLEQVTKIVLPLAKPTIAVTAMMVLVYVWNEYIFAINFMTGSDTYTLAAGLYSLQATEMSGSWPIFSAASLIVSLPILIVFFALQKNMTEGLTSGGVKG